MASRWARFLEPAIGEVEQGLGVARRHALEPADGRANRQSSEHVTAVVIGEEADGGPAGVEEEAGGVRAAVKRDHRVCLAVHDGQRHGPLGRLELLIGVR